MAKSIVPSLAAHLAVLFGELPQVVAVAVGGSLAGGAADAASDIDLYVYTRAEIPLSARAAIVERLGGASRADFDQNYWRPSDRWLDAATGIVAHNRPVLRGIITSYRTQIAKAVARGDLVSVNHQLAAEL